MYAHGDAGLVTSLPLVIRLTFSNGADRGATTTPDASDVRKTWDQSKTAPNGNNTADADAARRIPAKIYNDAGPVRISTRL